ncbi:BapA prefix-like domain-containing protein, partial [Pseudomonas syringae]|nr:BapA prefix-like domain-containing protein [Pseudomonas syringae]
MDNIVVADKATSEISAREWGSFQLAKPGVVQMPVAPSQIATVNRNGQDLLVTLKSGEKITISNFFATTAEGVQSDIVFVGEDGALWQAQYSADAFNGFTFAEVASIDTLIADAGIVGGATQTFAFAGLGLLGAGGAAAAAGGAGGGGGGGSDAPTAPDAPANLGLSTDGLTLNGTGTPGATVNVRDPNGTVVGSTVVGPDGNFSVPLDTPLNNGEPLVVDQTDPNGNTSGGTPINAPDTRAPLAPANLQVSNDGLTLTGIGEAGATVTVRDANGNVLGTAVVGADGTFSVPLGSAQLDGQVLNVDQADAAGNVSPEATVTALDSTAPGAPANLQVSADGLALTGTGEAGATVTVRGADGALLGTAIVAANGTFSVVLGSAQLDGQTLSVVQTDTAGNVSPAASTSAPDGNDAPGAPSNLQLSADGLTLSGRGEAGATVTVRGANGAVLGTAVVAANGTFSLTLGSAQLNGETLSVVQGNADGTSPVASLTAADVTAPAAPTNLLVSADGLTLTGRGEAGATVTVRAADGSVLGSAVVAADGTFSLSLGSAQTDGQVLSVSQSDAAGNLSPVTAAIAPEGVNAPSAPAALQLSADGLTLTGTGQPGATVTVRNADGSVLGSAVVSADGAFSLTLSSAQINGETLSVVQSDAFGNSSPSTSLTAADITAPVAPANLLVSADGLTLTGSGEAGATVTVRAADGSVLGSAVVAADGTFSLTLGTAQTDGQLLTVSQSDAAGNRSPSTSTTAPDGVDAPFAPSGLQLSADGLTLTGSGEAGATVTVRDANGATLGTAIVAADGTFSLTLTSAQLNGETLSVVQADANGTSPSASLTAADITAPVAPANLLVSA